MTIFAGKFVRFDEGLIAQVKIRLFDFGRNSMKQSKNGESRRQKRKIKSFQRSR